MPGRKKGCKGSKGGRKKADKPPPQVEDFEELPELEHDLQPSEEPKSPSPPPARTSTLTSRLSDEEEPSSQPSSQPSRKRTKHATVNLDHVKETLDFIRQRPILYDNSKSDYKDCTKKERMWKQLADTFTMDLADVQQCNVMVSPVPALHVSQKGSSGYWITSASCSPTLCV